MDNQPNQLLNKTHSDLDLLLCPFCHKNIPYLSLIRICNELKVKIFCVCNGKIQSLNLIDFYNKINSALNKNRQCKCIKTKDQSQMFYCPFCSEWLCTECLDQHSLKEISHSLILNCEVNIICKHKNKYEAFCHQCQINICKDCQPQHLNHKKVSIKQLDLNQFTIEKEKIELILEQISKKTNEFIEKINERLLLECGLDPNEQKKTKLYHDKREIEKLYEKNNQANVILSKIIQKIKNTTSVFKEYPIYELAKIVNDFTIDYYELKQNSIEDDFQEYYCNLRNYLNNNILYLQNSKSNVQTILSLHEYIIYSFIQLQNGQLVSGSGDYTIKLWSNPYFICLETLEGHTNYVFVLLELPNKGLASGSYDHTIRIWNLESYTCVATLSNHSNAVLCLLLFNGQLVSGSRDHTLSVWNYKESKLIVKLNHHTNSITALIDDGNNGVISASWDNTIIRWDNKFLLTKIMMEHTNYVSCLINLSNDQFASGSSDMTIIIWKKADYSFKILKGHSQGINALIQLSNFQLVSASNKEIKIWNVETYNNVITIPNEVSDCINCVVELVNTKLAYSCMDKNISLWDFKKGKFIQTIQNKQYSIKIMKMLNEGELAVCSFNNITIWNIAD